MTGSIYQSGLAFIEGLGLALSPCILPVLPLILGASAAGGVRRAVQIIIGFVLSFTLFALVSRQILAATGIGQQSVQTASYILLLLFGVVMLVPALEEKFARLAGGLAGRAQALSRGRAAESRYGGLLVGALIGLVWTPCAGPLLAAALLQVIQAQTHADAVATIFAFSLGAGLPMLLIALFGQYLVTEVRRFAAHAGAIRRVMGALVVVFAVLGLLGFNVGEWAAAQSVEKSMAVMTGRLEDGLATPYAAPDFAGIDKWFNTPAPLSMGDLKGKVVLVDFWTYSCINCIRTLPFLKAWDEKYRDQGLVIVGVHAPEFDFEGKAENVEAAIGKFGIRYPVAMDNGFSTWNAYKNRYWPAHYLIDRDGRVVYEHFGEGKYGITENNIRFLLGLDHDAGAGMQERAVTGAGQTPETYLGLSRAAREYAGAGDIPLHGWRLAGGWTRLPEYIETADGAASLTLHFAAKKVFLVMESATDAPVDVQIDVKGQGTKTVTVQGAKLYDVVTGDAFADGMVTLRPQGTGLRLYAFTFEG